MISVIADIATILSLIISIISLRQILNIKIQVQKKGGITNLGTIRCSNNGGSGIEYTSQ